MYGDTRIDEELQKVTDTLRAVISVGLFPANKHTC